MGREVAMRRQRPEAMEVWSVFVRYQSVLFLDVLTLLTSAQYAESYSIHLQCVLVENEYVLISDLNCFVADVISCLLVPLSAVLKIFL